MKPIRGADALCQTLRAAGVTRIFTLSGNHIMPVFDAALDAGIGLIHVRHEGACVHMADAYARLTGKPAVAMVTGGPGHANAVGALYTAQMSESPVLLLSGHAPNDQIGMGAFQEMRQAEMAAPAVKWSHTASGVDALAGETLRALRAAASGRPGPVHLSLPTDALESHVAQGSPGNDADATAELMALASADAEAAMRWLGGAQRPLILTGPVTLTRAGRALLGALEDASGVPVVGMESPRGVNDPALGAFAQALALADRVLLVGKRVDFTLKFGKGLHAAAEVMQIDADPAEIERARRALGTRVMSARRADAFSALAALTAAAGPAAGKASKAWRDEVRGAIAYRPAAWDSATSTLPDRLPPVQACRPLQTLLDSHPDAVLISDGGEFGQWAQACLSAPQRVINGPAGAIGAGLPFALGARAALDDMQSKAPIIALCGDGTFGFHPAEFDTAVRHKLPFVLAVGNDARWNAEYQIQLKSYGAERLSGCELLPTHYERVAVAFGGHGEFVTHAEDVAPAAQRALASGLPACLNLMIEGVPAPVVTRP